MQAVANVLIEGNCIKADKEAFCADKCKTYETGDDDWKPCVAECGKDSEYKAKAIAEALATIDVESSAACAEYFDPVGDAYAIGTQVNVRFRRYLAR